MTTTRAFAAAKINLFLHVGAAGGDGYHPLTSWMVFADVGDSLSLTMEEGPPFLVTGGFAAGLESPENLVLRARDKVLEAMGVDEFPHSLRLEKRLPVASGMGGGSSDAAAALRLVGKVVGAPSKMLDELARALGADVPACLRASSVMARGRGEALSSAPSIPPLPCVLVNPGAPVSTRDVFHAFDAGPAGDLSDGDPPTGFETPALAASFLRRQRNDLAPAAILAQPVIGQALSILEASPDALLARMTGSGATVFALCEDDAAAARLAAHVTRHSPLWWVRACRLS